MINKKHDLKSTEIKISGFFQKVKINLVMSENYCIFASEKGNAPMFKSSASLKNESN